MTNKKTKALKLALEANTALREWVNAVPINTPLPAMPGIDGDWLDSVDATIREALAEQPAQPATYTCGVCGVSMQMEQPAQRKPLTDEQLADFLGDEYHAMTAEEERYFRLAEAAHGIKEQP